ncbi:MAG: hypothetical protein IJK47_04675 [Lachnospiraceae bacterium]|nr:hypothetical protein [Lachnospiraceae bacterium]
MLSVWIKTGGVALIIVIGYIMKKTGALPESAAQILTKIMFRVTLPCVFICNLNGMSISRDFMSAFFWGFGVEVTLIIVVVLLSLHKPQKTVYVMQYCIPGFNISSFALPVAQIFLPEKEVSSLVLVNINVAIFFYVVTPVLVQIMAKGEKKVDLKSIGRNFLNNTPATVSVFMLLLCVLHISLPNEFITLIRPLANANTTVALLSIGLLFEFPKGLPKDNIKALTARLAVTISAALLAWLNIIPLGSVRNAMIIAMFAPLPTSAPAMALNYGFEGSEVAFGASATLIVSILSTAVLCAVLF